MIIEKVELKTGNASTSPTNYSPFKIGDEVEVTREEIGFTGALYEAIIVEPLKPAGSGPNLNPTPKKENKKRGFWVEYKHLLSDESESKPKREFVRKRSLLRPVPPLKYEGRRFIRVHDVVDAFYLAGWWTGVVVKVVGHGDGDGNGCKFRVAFKDPDEEIEFDEHELRLHLDWVGGNNWVRPGEKMPLQLGTSNAALDHTINETTSSNKKLEMEIRSDGVRPPKKLRSRKHRVEALENQEFPRPLVSGKAFTRKPRTLGSIDNQSSHAMEESKNCSSTEITRSSGDCNKLVEEGVDRELNKEDIENVVDVGILAPCVRSLKRTRDEDGKQSDSKFQIVEGTRERSTVDLSAHRSLAVPPGMEKQLLESTLHDSVNQQNANQAELSSTKTSGINTSAGVSAAAVQQCAGPTTQQPKKMPNAELSSITPEPSLALPFKKNSALWREFESMEIFAKIPQNPHFSPLIQYEEKKREEVALLKMTNYAFFVERIPKLTVAELNSSDLISDMLDSIKDLEEYGFDLVPVKRHLKDLLSNNERQTHLRNKLEEEEGKIRKCYSHKAIAKIEINKIALKIRDLEKELMSAKNVLETMDNHIKVSKSVKGAICDDLRHVERDIEGTVASVKQIFS
ncbi:DUF724 domain-containing protein 7-like isoform X1 [Lycium ferocissimum]|uniref:DUF724 domain-containing protein 7-like isoform X1 n=1 Tax=Lycium ferocissimum TaxID=112874 RepID=UPI00281539F6|nr:DUF724 domain-containing protein 7-like isoform X1 [Lycium ferocissimum]